MAPSKQACVAPPVEQSGRNPLPDGAPTHVMQPLPLPGQRGDLGSAREGSAKDHDSHRHHLAADDSRPVPPGVKPRGLARLAAGALLASTIGLGAGALSPAGIAHAYTGSCVGPVGAGNILQVRGLATGRRQRQFSGHRRGLRGHVRKRRPGVHRPTRQGRGILPPVGRRRRIRPAPREFQPGALLGLPCRPGNARLSAALELRAGRGPRIRIRGRGNPNITPQADEFYASIRLPDFRTGSTHEVETCRLSLAT